MDFKTKFANKPRLILAEVVNCRNMSFESGEMERVLICVPISEQATLVVLVKKKKLLKKITLTTVQIFRLENIEHKKYEASFLQW